MALTTVDDVAAMLRWGAAERAKFQSDLALYIAAASEIVEFEAGPVEPRTVTQLADGAGSVLLSNRVTLVQSVQAQTGDTGGAWVDGYFVPTDGWSSVDGWTVDLAAGIVHGPFSVGHQNIRVTYTSGLDPIPESLKLAATMIAADKWAIASQRAPGLDDQVDPSYLIPRAVRDLLAPWKATQMPGFA